MLTKEELDDQINRYQTQTGRTVTRIRASERAYRDITKLIVGAGVRERGALVWQYNGAEVELDPSLRGETIRVGG